MTFAVRTITTLTAVLVVAAVAPTPALSSAVSVIRDCSEDGVLDGKYSPSELDGALEQLPSDLDEYTDCRAVIRRAQLRTAGDKHRAAKRPAASDRVDAGVPPTQREQQQIEKASKAGDDPVRIGGTGVKPGESGAPFNSAGFGTDLPPLVLVVLIALGLSTLAGAALTARRRLGGPAAAGSGNVLQRVGEGVKRGISRLRR